MIAIGSRDSVLPRASGHAPRAASTNRHVTARAIDGIIELDAVATLEDEPTYRVRVLLKDGRLEKYAREYMHGEKDLRGVMNGWLVLSGRGSDPRNVRGRGQLKIQPAELYELPILVQILNVLRLAPPDKTAFRYALLDFDIADAQFRFKGIYLDGTTLSLRGRGTAAFDGTLTLDFYSMLPRTQYPIPVVNVLLREATRGWVGIEVRGKVDAPVARTKPIPNLDETLKGFLSALPKLGPPVLPPPPPPSRRYSPVHPPAYRFP
ncbi:MAG TPA: hypothetical protein EYP14_09015 [Planctomycetaceae bacterium]|nr:hypothetical protein [Planctomycetaceae bacterium]